MGHRRLRVGDYRIVYRVVGNEVRVLGIMHRSFVLEAIRRRVE
ncbi:MAG: type II toxin-antitoxin system RelE/ParE family toxin [Nitrospirae bacterium]|nr:type II toxin-antitoxin system RelE/ParE family toxin [Nitrospirota bacterium]